MHGVESVEGEATIRFRTSRVAHEHKLSKRTPDVFPICEAWILRAMGVVSEGLFPMLEHDILLLQPWDLYKRSPLHAGVEASASHATWAILEPNTRTLVGLARPGAKIGGFWKRCFGRALLAIYESEDEPLLCTLRHRWGLSSTWELRDADGHAVGRIARTGIQGPLNRYLIPVSRTNGPGTDFFDLQGRRLAALIRQRDGRLLSFAVECKGDPFARMLMLGAALVMNDS
jgi:hypothetical protein